MPILSIVMHSNKGIFNWLAGHRFTKDRLDYETNITFLRCIFSTAQQKLLQMQKSNQSGDYTQAATNKGALSTAKLSPGSSAEVATADISKAAAAAAVSKYNRPSLARREAL